MTLTTHAIVSIVLARYLPWPIAAFIAGFFGHYLMDVIPHGDEFLYARYVKNKKDLFPKTVAVIDVLCMLTLMVVFYFTGPPISLSVLFFAALGGITPDLLINLYTQTAQHFKTEYEGWEGQFQRVYHRFLQVHFKWHMFWHHLTHTIIRFRYGLAMQVVMLVALFWFHLKQ